MSFAVWVILVQYNNPLIAIDLNWKDREETSLVIFGLEYLFTKLLKLMTSLKSFIE